MKQYLKQILAWIRERFARQRIKMKLDGFNVYRIIVLAIIIVFYWYLNDNRKKQRESIKKNLCIVTSTIKKVGSGGYRGGYSRLYVEFVWKNEIVKADFASPNPKCNVVSSQLLLVVDSTDIENSVLLLKPEDFEEFNLTLPDSLNWTKECLKL